MTLKLSTFILAAAVAGAAAPVVARDAVQRANPPPQAIGLKDGETLYVFKDGKMAKEDKYGRAVLFKSGEVVETTEGRKVNTVGNEIWRLHELLVEDHRN